MFETVLNSLFDTSGWNMARKYVVRRRWFFTLVAVALLAIVWTVATKVWWVGDGYCFGTLAECMPEYFGEVGK